MYVELKYLKFLPLEGFTDKGNRKFNFRCPICGDSRKSKIKKRCWATEYKNKLWIKCFNCDYSSSFQYFLKNYFPLYYQDYMKEKFENFSSIYTQKKKKSFNDIFSNQYENLNLQKIIDLPSNHKAINFLKDRKIPKQNYQNFYYDDNFSKWINEKIEKGGINFQADLDRRIIIPFFNKSKKIFMVQGRSIDNIDPKYLTYKFDKDSKKIYGLDKIDFSKTVYVVEGPLDSLFIDNCLAVAGSLSNLEELLKYTIKENIVVIPDNDKNNYQTKQFIEKLINKDFNIVIWPKNINFKDINDAIIKDYTKEEIFNIITKNTFKGLKAIIEFKLKRM